MWRVQSNKAQYDKEDSLIVKIIEGDDEDEDSEDEDEDGEKVEKDAPAVSVDVKVQSWRFTFRSRNSCCRSTNYPNA